MLIANPIYDVVFKYLLEDLEIARELLSIILGEEVLSLDLKPQETAAENTIGGISILRFDFKAIIKTSTGEHKKALIELQKAKQAFDVMRFRRYLGDNYKKEDTIADENGEYQQTPLPIVTIYFLGFPLDNIKSAVVKINREYRDVITQEVLNVKEDFVELLTHDSYVIQLRLLAGQSRTKLEQVLQVFSPTFHTTDKHLLDFQGDMNEPLIQKMVARLGRAIASDEIRDIMDVEDEIERAFAKKDKVLKATEQALEIKEQELIAKKQRAETEKQRAETEKQRANALLKELEELRKQMPPQF